MNITEKYLVALEAEIKDFLVKHKMTESRFGREVSNNTELLPRFRRRQASTMTLLRMSEYMETYDMRAKQMEQDDHATTLRLLERMISVLDDYPSASIEQLHKLALEWKQYEEKDD